MGEAGAGQHTCKKGTFSTISKKMELREKLSNFEKKCEIQVFRVVLLHTEAFAEILFGSSVSTSKIYLD